MPAETMSGPIIGVFDSGFGGLTVLRELLPLVPGAQYLYLGDTARLPYGAKSRETIARYAVSSARFLVEQGAELLTIACNTATALALEDIRAAVPVPVIGVVEPGARAAQAALGAAGGEVLVLATSATVQSHAYRDTCRALGLAATEVACPLLVPLVEEGWTDHHVTREVLRIYLSEALALCTPRAVLLGCTHYPLICSAIESALRELGSNATVIDSAHATALAVAKAAGVDEVADDSSAEGAFRCFATDSVEKFRRLGSAFLGYSMEVVEHVDLGG